MHMDFNEHGQLKIRPTSQADCITLRWFVEQLRKHGAEMIDIETECPYEEQMARYGYTMPNHTHSNGAKMYNPYGYGPQSYMPMPPDFNPVQQYYYPVVYPVWFGRDTRQPDERPGPIEIPRR